MIGDRKQSVPETSPWPLNRGLDVSCNICPRQRHSTVTWLQDGDFAQQCHPRDLFGVDWKDGAECTPFKSSVLGIQHSPGGRIGL